MEMTPSLIEIMIIDLSYKLNKNKIYFLINYL